MTKSGPSASPTILTIGHSTRSLEALIALLKAHGVERLVDIRTIPRSRHNPQFNADTLPAALGEAGIAYEHRKGLGGLRHPRKDSPNGGWRNDGFRGFADYMQTDEFAAELASLIAVARKGALAIMCAEAVPWRCHRSLVSDALSIRGIAVEHILNAERSQPHHLTSFARVEGERITYPPSAAAVQPSQPKRPLRRSRPLLLRRTGPPEQMSFEELKKRK